MCSKTDPKIILICDKFGNEYSTRICSLLSSKVTLRDKHMSIFTKAEKWMLRTLPIDHSIFPTKFRESNFFPI